MKTIVKTLLAAAAAILVTGTAIAQNHLEDPRYGNTPEERTENLKLLNFLQDEMNAKNYKIAAEYVGQLMNSAPGAPNLYIWGATTYKNLAARAKSVAEKNRYVDSVMLIYDRRVEHREVADPNRTVAYILHRKAVDYASLSPMNRPNVRKFYKDAVEAGGDSVDSRVVLEYFQQLVNDYKGVQIQADELLTAFEQLSPLMENASEEQKDSFTGLFATSGAASCDVLEELYAKLLASAPDDVELLGKAYGMMTMIDCQSDFYVSVAEKHYAASPSTPVAIRLASVYENRQEYDKALRYLNEMLPTENDPTAKANLYIRMAASELGLNRGSAAASAARQAIALNSDSGLAHMFLAEAYMAGAGSCSGFHSQTVLWLAYDEFARARQAADGDAALISAIDSRMATCRNNFPTFEDGFMYVQGYANGKSYTVSCGWVSGTTTIRSR
ncbi:MAG: enzyme of heme biosynthesis [Alistipes sp.]|jgi:tetratricopeptide (TPR) repeat protein|nr:enzyme of heme biosynthesis [Alistipes sp.]